MKKLDELDQPISNDDLETLKPSFKNLQGNILRGHGRNRSVHIFMQFNNNDKATLEAVKKQIRCIGNRVTSAQDQLDEAEGFAEHNIPGSLFINFFLSAAGYKRLKCNLPGDSKEFNNGMEASGNDLKDPAKNKWEEGYQEEIHAMLLLADNDENFLLRKARHYLNKIRPIAKILVIEHGTALQNKHGENIEHFGYVDGRSQPLFFEKDLEREKTEKDGTSVWNPEAGANLVLVKDSNGGKDAYGSYLVFRKLEQNVRAFKKTEKQLAKILGLQGEDAERAGALVVGRFEDGTPVILQHMEGMHAPVPNNFTYADDPDGSKCPLQAHIRKVNPRVESERQHRIARRGIPYGEREKEPKDNPDIKELPTEGVGLLFMCYQSNIATQFEYIQKKLANNPEHLGKKSGIDPVIGQIREKEATGQQWPTQWGAPDETQKPFDFYGKVTLKGGEYFFAPSICFLKSI